MVKQVFPKSIFLYDALVHMYGIKTCNAALSTVNVQLYYSQFQLFFRLYDSELRCKVQNWQAGC